MKVILVNGSPHPHGCTFTTLQVVAAALNEEGIETQIFQVGTKPMSGCIACQTCAETGRCAFSDGVNDFLDMAGMALKAVPILPHMAVRAPKQQPRASYRRKLGITSDVEVNQDSGYQRSV
jgi:hypothetical protein